MLHSSGSDGFSLRKVAKHLGVAPNTLYSYFDNRDALVDALLDATLAAISTPEMGTDPTDGLRQIMLASYDALVEQPDLVPLYLARSGSHGEHAWRLGRRMLELLADAGVVGDRADVALQVLIVQAIGFAAFTTAGAAGGNEGRRAAFGQALQWLLAGIREP